MKQRKLQFPYRICITIEVVIAAAIAVLTALQRSNLVSLLFAASFVVAFAFVIFKIFEQNKINISIVLAVLCMFSVTLNGLQEAGSMNFDYFKKVIMFCCFMFLVYYSSEETKSFSNIPIKMIEIFPVIAGSYLAFSYYYLGNTEELARGITLGFTNPNFTGMWLLHFFLYGVLFVLKAFYGGCKLRLLYIPVLVVIYNLIPETGARSCLIGVISFFLIIVLKPVIAEKPKLYAILIAIFPLALAIFYLTVVDKEWFQEFFAFMVSKGKNLDSRNEIWHEAFKYFGEHPFLGNYSGSTGGTGQGQMHNTHVDVLASYGIFAFVIFIKMLYDRLVLVCQKISSLYQTAAFAAFCAVIVTGSFEAAMVSGAMGLNLLTVAFLLLAQSEGSEATSPKRIGIVLK